MIACFESQSPINLGRTTMGKGTFILVGGKQATKSGTQMKLRKLALLALTMLTTAASAESWFCTAEKSTGFAPIKGRWEHASVMAGEQKFVLRELTDEEKEIQEIAPEVHELLRRELLSSEDNDAVGKLDTPPKYTHAVTRRGENFPSFMCVFRGLSKKFLCDGLLSQSKFVFKRDTGRFVISHMATGGYLKGKDDIEYADLYLAIGRC